MSPPVVWRAEPDEAEAVARLMVEFRDFEGREWPSANAFLASIERLIERQDTEFLLGAPDRDSAPAGVCQLRYRYSVWTATDDCWLEDLFVRTDARRQGLGRALVEAACARADERGCRRIELDVYAENASARELYGQLGFAVKSLFMQRPLG